jgi:hypothetical protein
LIQISAGGAFKRAQSLIHSNPGNVWLFALTQLTRIARYFKPGNRNSNLSCCSLQRSLGLSI